MQNNIFVISQVWDNARWLFVNISTSWTDDFVLVSIQSSENKKNHLKNEYNQESQFFLTKWVLQDSYESRRPVLQHQCEVTEKAVKKQLVA